MQRYKMFPLEKHKTALKREFLKVNCHSSILTIYFRIFAEFFFQNENNGYLSGSCFDFMYDRLYGKPSRKRNKQYEK